MPLKKFIPSRSNFVSLGDTKVANQPFIPTSGPVLVPNNPPQPPLPPVGGAFSNAFSNAFNI